MEAFDAKKISFVAVTQQFNTTTSMGRLTLNVLLSFAQFERELSSERVRDKVAASRKKGKWMGGSVPLGYDSKEKKLIVNPSEAKIVRLLFDRYLVLKSLLKLTEELRSRGIVTKKRAISSKAVGGVHFTYGPLAYLLKNRTYLGETGHKDKWFPGEHERIIDDVTFEKVQALLKSNSVGARKGQQSTGALLNGVLFDNRGNRMSPSFTVKRGVRYPFYISSAIRNGRKADAGSIKRVSATEIEPAVTTALRDTAQVDDDAVTRDIVKQSIQRVVLHEKRVVISLKNEEGKSPSTIELPWQRASKRSSATIEGGCIAAQAADPKLMQAVVRAHAWLKLLSDGSHDSVEALATAVRMHPKVVRNRICLAFLAPSVTAAILHGEQPANVGLQNAHQIASLRWGEQYRILRSA